MSAALFVDGAALRIAAGQLGIQVDFTRLRRWACTIADSPIVEAYWFDATGNGLPTSYHHALRVNGFRTHVHEIQEMPLLKDGRLQYDRDGNPVVSRKQVGVDVALACKMLESRARCQWETLVLVAGDGDLEPPIREFVERHGVQVILLGTQRARSHRLIPWAASCHDLDAISESIARQPVAPTAPIPIGIRAFV